MSHFEETPRPIKINLKDCRNFLGSTLPFGTIRLLFLLDIAIIIALSRELEGNIESHCSACVANETRQSTGLVILNHLRCELDTTEKLVFSMELSASLSVLVGVVQNVA